MVEDQPTPSDVTNPMGGRAGTAAATPGGAPAPGVTASNAAPQTSAPSIPPQAPVIGGGRYALVSKIAEGGMAGVYRSWDHKMRVWRAIKVLLPEYTRKDILRARFEGEAKTMARLDHPNVVRVYDVGTKEPLPYMVMELAEGGTVNGWLDAYGRMPPRLAVSVIVEVAKGLAAAHALGVVHRDVKPHNVLVTADGLCKITDFGIAHGAMDADGRTSTNATMGTIGYMAPEQRADARLVDVRADVYSLGAMLYKLVVGKVMTDLFLVEHEPRLLEPVPGLLHEVVVRACFHDRERRYPSAQAMIAALSEIAALLPPDPPDTPALALPIRTEPASVDGFPEIGVLLGMAPPKPISLPPLPYTMPRTAGRRSMPPAPGRDEPTDGDRPAYVDASAAPAPLKPAPAAASAAAAESVVVVGASAKATPGTKVGKAGSKDAVPTRGQPMWPPFVTGLAMATVAMWGIVIVLTGAWTFEIHSRANVAIQARRHVMEVVDQERNLIQELSLRGSPPSHVAELTELYGALAAAPEGLPRAQALRAYLSAARAESDAVLGGAGPTDLTAMRARNLRQAEDGYRRARARWANATWWPQGWLAIQLGLAPAPPPL